MGYWAPPGIHAYDPFARPLGGIAAMSEEDVLAFQKPEVLAALGVGTLLDAQAKEWLRIGGRIWVPDLLDVPLLHAMRPSALVKGRGLLLAYTLLIELRPPSDSSGVHASNERLHGPFSPEIVFPRYFYGDLPGGGLPPDVMQPPIGAEGPSGALVQNYWDLSDSNWPRRKCVTYWPKSALVGSGEDDQATGKRPYKNDDGIVSRVMQWNFDQHHWEDEGGDVEREVIASSAEIVSTVLLVLKMVVSCIPLYGGVFTGMIQLSQDAWALSLRHMRPDSGPITPDEVFSSLGGDFIGLVGSFGGTVVGQTPDGKPITTGDVLSRFATDTFNGALAKAGAVPVIGIAANVTADAVSQSTKYVKGLIEVGKIYGVANLKIDVSDVRKFVAGQIPTVPVQTKIIGGETQAELGGNVPTPPSPAAMSTSTYQRQAWDAACVAFAIYANDPVGTLRMRRNAVLNFRNTLGGNSATIVTPGDEGGIGAHGVEDLTDTAVDVGTAFDQYLSQMYANEWAGSIQARAQYAVNEYFPTVGTHAGDPRAALNAMIVKLKARYGI